MVQEIELSKLMLHPKNVRKNYSDIDELAESIKAKGILQNLTVVRNPDMPDTYLVVIGNRRLAAARKAGLKTAPCTIAEMDEKEQAETMLLENMERNDLTIYEQGQGFQMCLDLGETEADLAEKTGFSKTTIRHRLNIAKLNQEALQELEGDDSFQLTLKDLYELEKIPDVEERNKILEQASSSNDIAFKVKMTLLEKMRKENAEKIVSALEDMGVKEATQKMKDEAYSSKWQNVKYFQLDDGFPEAIDLGNEDPAECRWMERVNSIRVFKKTPKQEPTEYDIEQRKIQKRKDKLKELSEKARDERTGFILLAREKEFKLKTMSEEEAGRKLFMLMIRCGGYLDESTLFKTVGRKDRYALSSEGKLEEAREEEGKVPLIYQLLLFANDFVSREQTWNWNDASYNGDTGEKLMQLEEVLIDIGFAYNTSECWLISSGAHQLYKKEDEVDDEDPEVSA